MAIVSGTALRYTSIGEREALSDVIYNISPEETVFTSSIGRGAPCTQSFEEWQTDALAAAVDTNAHLEGDETTFTAPDETVRVGTYTQISKKSLIVSGTRQATRKAGRKNERAYLMAKKGVELRLDMEKYMLSNQAAVVGNSTTARRTGALASWVRTNVDLGTGGANPAAPSPAPLAARTDGTQRALTETILKNIIQLAWTQGGKPRILMVGPVNKTRVSTFAGVVTRNFDMSNVSPKPTAIIAAADVYVSDFGIIRVVPNRLQRERDAWLVDPSLACVRFLRPFFTEELAKTGDAKKEHMLVEWLLEVRQEKGLALAADLTTT